MLLVAHHISHFLSYHIRTTLLHLGSSFVMVLQCKTTLKRQYSTLSKNVCILDQLHFGHAVCDRVWFVISCYLTAESKGRLHIKSHAQTGPRASDVKV